MQPRRPHHKTCLFAFVLLFAFLAFAARPALAQVQLPEFNTAERINVAAQTGNRWQVGAYEVWVLRGDCVIQQGNGYARCQEAVLWIDRAEAIEQRPNKIIAYLEGAVEIVHDRRPGGPRLQDKTWFGRFQSSAGVEVRTGTVAGKPEATPAIYQRFLDRWNSEQTAGDNRRRFARRNSLRLLRHQYQHRRHRRRHRQRWPARMD